MIFANVKAVEIPEGTVKQIAGGGVVLWKKSGSDLPSGYRQVLDLTLKNAKFVANLYLTGDDTLRFSVSGKTGNWIGSYHDSSASDNYSLYATTSASGKYLRYNGGVHNSSMVANEHYDIVITPTGSSGNKVPETWSKISFTCSIPLCIGGTSPTGTPAPDVTFYGVIEVDGRAKFIPCERVSDGELGYYDTSNKEFLTSADGTVTTSGYAE